MELLQRIWYFVNRRRFEREVQDETAAHRPMMADARRFGNALTLREESRDAWGWGSLDRALQDARQAARVLRRAPGFSITAILILSFGIGPNLTFFHLLSVTALEPLAVKDPESLVRFHRRGPTFSSDGMPYPATEFIREHNDVLAAVLTEQSSHVVWEGVTQRIAVSSCLPTGSRSWATAHHSGAFSASRSTKRRMPPPLWSSAISSGALAWRATRRSWESRYG